MIVYRAWIKIAEDRKFAAMWKRFAVDTKIKMLSDEKEHVSSVT